MAQNETLLTYEGLKKLEEEVEYLKTVKRREIAERIKVALGFGDLSENSEYDEAKNEQAQVEMRIAELENKLRNVKIIDEDEIETKTVQVGNVVQVLDIEYDEKRPHSGPFVVLIFKLSIIYLTIFMLSFYDF